MTARREDIRNIAIIAHVDHGKTTLVDAMLHASGAFRANQDVAVRAMDSMDQERERGITILAKNTSVDWNGTRINIVDTPGHADFGGEVERGLTMVDGAVLLVDAGEGPLPQTRFVLRKALALGLPVMLIVNKIDRPDARPHEVVDEVWSLLIDLDADASLLDHLPVLYTNAKAGTASTRPDEPGADLDPLFSAILEHVPAPLIDPDAPLQALVTNLDASPYLGRLALCRVHSGEIKRGQQVAWCREDGTTRLVKVTELLAARAMERESVERARAGDIVAIAGIDEITIGDTLADPEDPRPLPRISVDEPSVGMVIGINASPLSGRSGNRLTARQIKARLDAELIGNVSINVRDIGRPDAWEVQGRGEMQLAVLVESMRREGFELTVGKPQVLVREIDGKAHEPMELVVVDIPDDHVGTVTQLMSGRKGRLTNMISHGTGWSRLELSVPARGLIGIRTALMTETRGTAVMSHELAGWEPWLGEIRGRSNGSLVADRPGAVTGYALLKLEDRGTFFVSPGDTVYEGCIVGEHIRPEDLDINAVREKHVTNHRASTGEELVRLAAPRKMTLDEAIEFIADDECVEVTPDALRLRKATLTIIDRTRERSRALAAQQG